jgi:hypothetical protein
MPLRRHRKSVLLCKLNAQLELFVRTRDIQAGSRLAGASVRSPNRSLERQAGPHAQDGEGVPNTPPRAPSRAPSSELAPGGAQSIPSSPVPYDDTGGLDNSPASNVTSPAGRSALGAMSQELIQPEPLEGHDPEEGLRSTSIHLPDLQTTQHFVDSLCTAVLESSGMHDEDINSLCNPGPEHELVDPSPLLWSIRHFINNLLSSRDHYEMFRCIELADNPNDPMLTFDQVKCRVRWLSGVVPLEHDMCPNTCVAYTGPYSDLEHCPRCADPCYLPGGTKKPQRRFTTMPIGPVIQAFYGSREVTERMHYLETRLAENLGLANASGGKLAMYDDTACGKELLDAWSQGHFQKTDIALQFSIDGAQLHSDRQSESWVFIWVIHNLPPEMRYKKAFVIPGAIVSGPNKPGDIDSFLFPSLYHVAALQREGLRVYDAHLDKIVPRAIPVVLFGMADSLGSASMSGMVGHSGKFCCRLYCDMPGQRRDGDSHYYPVMKLPHEYTVSGCCHLDVSINDLASYRKDLPRKYSENIKYLLASDSQTAYRARRLDVGLCKQTLFSGLPVQLLCVPNIFTMDIMHLSVLNDLDLFLKLFTGKMDVYEPDNRETWDWAVFYKNTALWNAHRETVSRAVPFIPSSFGRAPRDPAKKINSGYKAWEYQQYIYGLRPTLF